MATLNVGSEGLGTGGVNSKVGVGTTSPAERLDVEGGNLKIGGGGYNNGHLILGNYNLWVDANGELRIKNGVPSTDLDGVTVGSQT